MPATLAPEVDPARSLAGRTRRAPTVRVLPVPRSEPPTDDERRDAGLEAPPMAAQLLPLDLPTGVQVRRAPRPSRGDDAAPDGDGPPPGGEAAGGGSKAPDGGAFGATPLRPTDSNGRTERHQSWQSLVIASGLPLAGEAQAQPPDGGPERGLPDGGPERGLLDESPESPDAVELRLTIRRFLATCVEVVGGYRPLGQLRPFCRPERFDSIVNRLLRPAGSAMGRGHGATRASVVAGHGSPPGAGRLSRPGPGERVIVRRVQLCDVREDIAEIAVVMARRDKVWAMAIRMELARGRWQCAHLEVL